MDRKMIIRMTLSVVALALMAAGADLLGEREVIFPEVAALAIGLWTADRLVWNVHAREVPLLMTLSAVIGVLITRHVGAPVLVQLTMAFAVSALLMTTLRIPLIPSIAAILLPILLNTQSWLYPASVAVMTSIMAAGVGLLQRAGLKATIAPVGPREGFTRHALLEWAWRYVLLLPLLAVATSAGWLFAIVPPLVIILIELTNTKNMFRNRPLPLWATAVAVAAMGTASRWLVVETLSLPYAVAVSVAFAAALALMWKAKMMFPPIPALAVIPFILPSNYMLFPLEVALGAAYAIVVPLVATSLRQQASRVHTSNSL